MTLRRRSAINKAFRHLVENLFINYENGKLLILSDSRTETGEAKFYETGCEDLDTIYLKAAGCVIQHVLSDNAGNLRRAATALGASHSTLSRIMKKFNQNHERQNFQTRPPANGEQRTAAA